MSAWKFMDDRSRIDVVRHYADKGHTIETLCSAAGVKRDVAERFLRKHGIQLNTDEGTPAAPPAKPPENPACEGTVTPAAAEHAPSEGGPDGTGSAVAGATSDGGGGADAIATVQYETARARPIPESASPPPQIKRQKETRPQKTAGEAKVHFTSQKQLRTIVTATKVTAPLRERQAKVMARAREELPDDLPALRSKRQKRMASAGEPHPPLPLEPKVEPAADELAVTIYLPRRVLAVLQERAQKPRWTRAQMAAAMVIQACNKKE